jgi:hypothetical protein
MPNHSDGRPEPTDFVSKPTITMLRLNLSQLTIKRNVTQDVTQDVTRESGDDPINQSNKKGRVTRAHFYISLHDFTI